jgi:hypothetical protein
MPGGNTPAPGGATNPTGTTPGTTPSTTPSTTPGATPSTVAPSTVAQLLADAQTHFTNADNALKASPPDLGTYQREVQLAEADIAKAAQQSGATPPPAAPASTTTTAKP